MPSAPIVEVDPVRPQPRHIERATKVLVDAKDIKEHVGNRIDLILDGGVQPNEPSTVVSLIDDHIEVLRQGKGIIVT